MKKLALIALVFSLLSGCAAIGTQKRYTVPPEIADRANAISYKVVHHMYPQCQLGLVINASKSPGAWVDGENLIMTEGMFRFDDDTLTFVIAHEIAHDKLKHLPKINALSWGVTGIMTVVDLAIPGTGYLNYAVNPAITRQYSKKNEYEADLAASRACLELGISLDRQIQLLKNLDRKIGIGGGGFWDEHPAWIDRIANIREHSQETGTQEQPSGE